MAELKGTNLEEAVRWVCDLLVQCLVSGQLPMLSYGPGQCLAVHLLSMSGSSYSTDLCGFQLHMHTQHDGPSRLLTSGG